MNLQFEELYQSLLSAIQLSYESGVTMDEAEKLAGKFLYGQMMVANELSKLDLDARMRKSGLKAIKAAVYLEEAFKGDKKPSDVMLQAKVDQSKIVASSQQDLDEAEVVRDRLQNYLSTFKDAHVHYRSIAKGRFE